MWQTNINIHSIVGEIQVGDLNGDNALEVYLSDTTGTTIKYVSTPTGLKTLNENIFYGEKYIVQDFNNDGICDYMIFNLEGKTKLFTS